MDRPDIRLPVCQSVWPTRHFQAAGLHRRMTRWWGWILYRLMNLGHRFQGSFSNTTKSAVKLFPFNAIKACVRHYTSRNNKMLFYFYFWYFVIFNEKNVWPNIRNVEESGIIYSLFNITNLLISHMIFLSYYILNYILSC